MKCIVVDAELPVGMIANAAAILGASIGAGIPGIIGPIAIDGDGREHSGLVNVPLPILQSQRDALASMRTKAMEDKDLLVFDFAEPARKARTYDGYLEQMSALPAEAIEYVALALHGPSTSINKLTGQLKLVR
jgi:hypothetical protein